MQDSKDWEEEKKPINIADMKHMIEVMRELKKAYEAAKECSNECHELFKTQEAKVIAAFESSGLSKFNIPGVGTAYTVNRYKYRVPKDLNAKRELFNFIKDRHGADVADGLGTINYQSLNSFCKAEVEAELEKGNPNFKIPGLEDPLHEVGMGFRGESKGEA
jgi:hypothetical protein